MFNPSEEVTEVITLNIGGVGGGGGGGEVTALWGLWTLIQPHYGIALIIIMEQF